MLGVDGSEKLVKTLIFILGLCLTLCAGDLHRNLRRDMFKFCVDDDRRQYM